MIRSTRSGKSGGCALALARQAPAAITVIMIFPNIGGPFLIKASALDHRPQKGPLRGHCTLRMRRVGKSRRWYSSAKSGPILRVELLGRDDLDAEAGEAHIGERRRG